MPGVTSGVTVSVGTGVMDDVTVAPGDGVTFPLGVGVVLPLGVGVTSCPGVTDGVTVGDVGGTVGVDGLTIGGFTSACVHFAVTMVSSEKTVAMSTLVPFCMYQPSNL